ncbi:MAG: hypothetical protein HY701_10475 [Gemmatimonadetes bacterium]|nr:hypothetical protein [Gemmatimonadota bacterium]
MRRRPTPVREALGQAGGPVVAAAAGGAGGAETAEAAPSRLETLRHFRIDGQAWTARVAGRAVGGTGCSPPARLMAIDFFRAENPDQPVSRAVLQGRDLDALFDEEIVALFTHAAAVEKGTEQRKDTGRGADRKRRRSGRPERGF